MRFAVIFAVTAWAFLLHPSGQAPTWKLLEESPFQGWRQEDIFFVHPDTGWTVNLQGEVYSTTDGGGTWSYQQTGVSGLRSMGFADSQRGWIGVLGGATLLLETTDGGQSWNDITARLGENRGFGICGIHVLDADHIVAVGRYNQGAHVYRTQDGGQTWTTTNLAPLATTLVDAHFFDAQNGIIVGGGDGDWYQKGRAVVLRTTDGGESWERVFTSSDVGEWAWKISFPTPETGYVSVEHGDALARRGSAKVLKTTDGGRSWTERAVPNAAPLQGIGFIDANTGWVSGRGTDHVTTDGGETWTRGTALLPRPEGYVISSPDWREQAKTDGWVNHFRFLGDSVAYAAGRRIYKLDLRD
ncbi:MAG: YCF48-related protein [Bacteroidota bacterium]